MTSTTQLHPPGRKFPPLLPKNFYEAPQYNSYAPTPLASIPSPSLAGAVKATAKRRGRPLILHPNSLKPYLERYSSPGHALTQLPHLDNIVSGMVNLNFGENTKPFSKKLMLVLLRRLDVISTANVEEHMLLTLRECSPRNAQRIASCLRVIELTAAKLTRTIWAELQPVDDDHMYAPVQGIPPCGQPGCPICSRTAALADSWTLLSSDDEDSTDDFVITGSSCETADV